MKTRLLAPVALIGLTLLAGCGKSDNRSQTPSGGAAAPTTALPAPTTQMPTPAGSMGH